MSSDFLLMPRATEKPGKGAVQVVWRQPSLTMGEKGVYERLHFYDYKPGTYRGAFCGEGTLADELGCTKRQVGQWRRRLEETGLIFSLKVFGFRGNTRSYFITNFLDPGTKADSYQKQDWLREWTAIVQEMLQDGTMRKLAAAQKAAVVQYVTTGER